LAKPSKKTGKKLAEYQQKLAKHQQKLAKKINN
jgi:hypothetical protein